MTTDISTIEQELTEAIVKAVPDTMIYSTNVIQQAIGVYVETHDISDMSYRELGAAIGCHIPHPQSIKHHLQMLGVNKFQKHPRPITLDDICRAMIAANEFTMPNFERLFTHYIFGKPLNEQDDTVKRLLHSMLCNKE